MITETHTGDKKKSVVQAGAQPEHAAKSENSKDNTRLCSHRSFIEYVGTSFDCKQKDQVFSTSVPSLDMCSRELG